MRRGTWPRFHAAWGLPFADALKIWYPEATLKPLETSPFLEMLKQNRDSTFYEQLMRSSVEAVQSLTLSGTPFLTEWEGEWCDEQA
jgi:hypothetical protein